MTGATPNTSFIPKLQIKQQVVSSSPTFTTSHAPSLMTSRPIIKSTPSQGIASPRNVYRTVKTSRKASGAAALVGPVSSVSKGSPSAAPATGTTPAILTFGDSLTHGWTVQGGQPKPYGVFLAQLLGVQRESVVCAGKAGQKAAEMASRLASELSRGCHFDGHAAATAASIEEKLLLQYGQDKMRRNQAMKRPFDVVVVLGGTNDVRTGASPEAVLSHLSVLHQLVRGCGAHCVAVTVPPCGQNGRTIAAVRQAVNDGLRMASRGSNLVVADFDAELSRMAPVQRDALYTGDMLHFNESGYRFLAATVEKVIQPLLGQNVKRLQPSAPFLSVPRPLALPVASPETKRPRLAHDKSSASVGVGMEVISAITSSAGRLSAVSAAAITSAFSATYARQSSCKTILAKTISAIMPTTTIKTSRALPAPQQRAILVA